MNKWNIFVVVFIPIILFNISYSEEIKYFESNLEVNHDGLTDVHVLITVPENKTELKYMINVEIKEILFDLKEGQSCESFSTKHSTFINCSFENVIRTVEFEYKTNGYVDKNFRIYNFETDKEEKTNRIMYYMGDLNISSMLITMKLPEGSAIHHGTSPSPDETNIISDGRSIIVTWEKTKTPEKSIMLFYEYINPPNRNWWVIILLSFLILGLIIYLYIRKKRGKKAVVSILDDYERNVLEVIKKHGGSVTQNIIVDETDFSKAKVSRVIKDLSERRGLISVERIGRKNKIKLLEKNFI